MKKILIATAAAATADDRQRGRPAASGSPTWAQRAPLIGGLAAGALLGAAVANGPITAATGPGPYYASGPAYYGPELLLDPPSGLDRLRLAPASRAGLRLTEVSCAEN